MRPGLRRARLEDAGGIVRRRDPALRCLPRMEGIRVLSVEHVHKAYRNVPAVVDLSFETGQGSIFGLIGPNGAGKSTTIRMIMNIIAPDSGSIRFDGSPFSEAMKSRIGYLPEERGLYKKVKVQEMLLYLATLKGMKESAAKASAGSWLGKFDLSDWKNRPIAELSKGMAQKVQFIGSVVHDPELVLFDEPFSGLDPLSQDLLLESLIELKRQGKTIIFSTHVMEHAEKICDRILLVDKGREVVSGSVGEVKDRYGRNAVQLEFDGDGSFIAGLPMVGSVSAYPRWIDVELKAGADSETLLAAIVGKLRLRRFETMAPSLHKIFVALTGGRNE
jgi:ABC-2 type transport system ATP-binding protein